MRAVITKNVGDPDQIVFHVGQVLEGEIVYTSPWADKGSFLVKIGESEFAIAPSHFTRTIWLRLGDLFRRKAK